MSEKNVNSLMDVTMEKLRAMVDADIITGTPIEVNGITMIPVSRVSFGLATGGSDFPSKSQKELFGGAGGAGVTVSPIAFIVISGDNVKMMPIYNELSSFEKAVSMLPELVDKAKEILTKKENKD